MKNFLIYLLFFILAISTGCTKTSEKPVMLQIAAAASLTDVMKELSATYQKEHTGVSFSFNFGSSGALQQAIGNGGRADLFISAATKQLNALEKAGLIENDTRRELLVNSLVLIVPAKSRLNITNFDQLKQTDIKHIAVGGKGVPVGQYTKEVFDKLNLSDALNGKLVLATDSRQVLAWVASGEADCGIVYSTDASVCKDVRITANAPSDSHSPIIYPAAVLRESNNKTAATDYLNFLCSEQAGKIFKKYGFTVK